MIRCPEAAMLAQVLRGEAPAEAAEHVKTCLRCRKRAALVRDIVASHRGDAALAFRHVRFGDNVRRKEASRIVDALTNEPVHRWPLIARSDEGIATTAVLDELLRRALTCVYSEPHRARAFASAALEISRRLQQAGATTPENEARAYRDAAVIEKICGSPDAALALLDHAKAAAERCTDPEYELALVEIRRARWYVDPDSTIEGDAVAIADACEPVFLQRGDARHLRMARHTKAAALLQGGHADGAAAVYREIIDDRDTPPVDSAFAADALSAALVRLGCASEALSFSEYAVRTLGDLNMTVAVANSRCRLANAYDALGRYDEALEMIDAAIPVLKSAEKFDACIRAELTRVRITLHARPSADVADACAAIASRSINLDSSQQNRRRIATAEALAYLRDAAMRRVVSASIVEHVDSYIAELDSGRFVRFTPPVPPLLM